MKKWIVVLLALLVSSNAFAFGGISGDVFWSKDPFRITETKMPAVSYTVFVLDAITADLYRVATDDQGHFSLENLPPGAYKVRVQGYSTIDGHTFGVEEYISCENEVCRDLDIFDGAEIFYVYDNRITTIEHTFLANLVDLPGFEISGELFIVIEVVDFDGNIIENIFLDTRNPINAMYITSRCYRKDIYYVCSMDKSEEVDIKLRAVDQSGEYLSEYYGAGSNNFSLGEVVSLDEKTYLNFRLKKLSPEVIVDAISSNVANLELPADVEGAISSSLERATDFLTDSNPNNDKASCGALNGLVGQINGMVNSGQITENDAYWLKADVEGASVLLGCD